MSLVDKLLSLSSGVLVAGGISLGASQAFAQDTVSSSFSKIVKVEDGRSVQVTTRCRGDGETLPEILTRNEVDGFNYEGINFSQSDNLIITACTSRFSDEFFNAAVEHAIQIDKDFHETIKFASELYDLPLGLFMAKVAIEGGQPYSNYPTGGGENSHTGAKGISQIFPAAVLDAIKYTGAKGISQSPLYQHYGEIQKCEELVRKVDDEDFKKKREVFTKCWKENLGDIIEGIRDDPKLNIIAGYAYGAYIMENFANKDAVLTAIMYNSGLSISTRSRDITNLIKSYSERKDKSMLDIYPDGLHLHIKSPADSRYATKWALVLREFSDREIDFLSSTTSARRNFHGHLEVAQNN